MPIGIRRAAGPVYQGRLKSFPVQTDEHFLRVARYVEGNALRAKLVERAENWQWLSLYLFLRADGKTSDFLNEWRMERPKDWIEFVNGSERESELDNLRSSAQRGRPFGNEDWVIKVAKQPETYALRESPEAYRHDFAVKMTLVQKYAFMEHNRLSLGNLAWATPHTEQLRWNAI